MFYLNDHLLSRVRLGFVLYWNTLYRILYRQQEYKSRREDAPTLIVELTIFYIEMINHSAVFDSLNMNFSARGETSSSSLERIIVAVRLS